MSDNYSISFLFAKGNVEILKFLEKSNKPIQFKELKTIVNPKTSKKFSSSTIASSIRELEDVGVIKNEIINKKKRKVIGYSITNSGKRTLLILRETAQELDKLYKKSKKE